MTMCHKKIVRVFVGETHTHSRHSRNALVPVSVLCSKLEDVDVNILLAGRLSSSTGHTVGVILLGRCAGLGGVWFDSTAS